MFVFQRLGENSAHDRDQKLAGNVYSSSAKEAEMLENVAVRQGGRLKTGIMLNKFQ